MTNEEIYLNQLAGKGKVTNNENIFGTMLLERFQKKQEWKKRMNNLMKSIK
jgi:hypothetical protein